MPLPECEHPGRRQPKARSPLQLCFRQPLEPVEHGAQMPLLYCVVQPTVGQFIGLLMLSCRKRMMGRLLQHPLTGKPLHSARMERGLPIGIERRETLTQRVAHERVQPAPRTVLGGDEHRGLLHEPQ